MRLTHRSIDNLNCSSNFIGKSTGLLNQLRNPHHSGGPEEQARMQQRGERSMSGAAEGDVWLELWAKESENGGIEAGSRTTTTTTLSRPGLIIMRPVN
ncbi:hypothetical protein Bca52824_047233 [Brassica carinata]|uniref:Uncharacterized protein n=1 Tax=Brassica carinata TaxID=52824 RepID=A0A8X7REF1_BRACI|nr:hypothetical protein Bca52824_047233 [Brassica carinata]